MPICARTIGGPGAGKTTRALSILDKVLSTGIADPFRVGFVSFTRAARHEAASRAGANLGIAASDLERNGWFRTLHSIAYRQLRVEKDALLAGSKDDNEWLKKAVNDSDVAFGQVDTDEEIYSKPTAWSATGQALAYWDVARNRLCSVREVWEKASAIDPAVVDIDYALEVVGLYEEAKRKDCRLDFADLLLRYCGRRWTGTDDTPFEEVEPEGEVPFLPVWFHDEMQDCSRLTAAVFERLVKPSQWVYLFGDDWQAIYGWSGADGRIFADWPVAKEECLPISHRCPSRILDYATEIMLNGDSVPRQFAAHREGGELDHGHLEDVIRDIDLSVPTLVLARTNQYAQTACAYLDSEGIPWVPTKGGGGANAPAKVAAIQAIQDLRSGKEVTGLQIHRLLGVFPSRLGGEELFIRGTKKFYEDETNQRQVAPLPLNKLVDAGATPLFQRIIADKTYFDALDKPATKRLAVAADTHGMDAILNPKVRVGTCHSSKGAEAEHVVAVSRIPMPVARAIATPEGMEEERRVWYVTLTRARERLTIADAGGISFPEL